MMANISSFGLYLFAILLFLSGVNHPLANNAAENNPHAAHLKEPSKEDRLELAIQSVMRAMEDGFARTAQKVGGLREEMKSSKKELSNAVNTITSSVRNSVNKATVCPTESVIPPANCHEIQKRGQSSSGVYSVIISGKNAKVYCDMSTNGGGWTVIHRRHDFGPNVDFNRRWAEYKTGFGDLNGKFWLGLDNIHGLTSDPSTPMRLRIDLEDWEGEKRVALYKTFRVGGEEEKYKLTVGGFEKGPGGHCPGDSLDYHNGWTFTTRDQDNDGWSGGNCAELYKGGWWYDSCHYAQLNGVYLRGTTKTAYEGVVWYYWKGKYYSMKRASMMIRPR